MTLFSCFKCGEAFPAEESLFVHLETHHVSRMGEGKSVGFQDNISDATKKVPTFVEDEDQVFDLKECDFPITLGGRVRKDPEALKSTTRNRSISESTEVFISQNIHVSSDVEVSGPNGDSDYSEKATHSGSDDPDFIPSERPEDNPMSNLQMLSECIESLRSPPISHITTTVTKSPSKPVKSPPQSPKPKRTNSPPRTRRTTQRSSQRTTRRVNSPPAAHDIKTKTSSKPVKSTLQSPKSGQCHINSPP
eukprot:277745_1